ncbi:hypothetical protein BDV95DRAFT_604372 [Massariosphaeria phaeospora]|uniref:Pyridoxamine 5'-phosphate oxidase-domain-containing protein n=1 Tax=Massariosphaeria phaeospora TaxID=100035 RepID=A0A7C8MBN8_9PLEO|nr:hypothetical protein BDV95DRAFT_604372 [Massariosphaeria phaeospora]
MHFILLFVLFLGSAFSNADPDSEISKIDPLVATEIRSPDSMLYNVFPSDPDDADACLKTKAYLTSISQNVVEDQDSNKHIFWKLPLENDSVAAQLKAYEGVKTVEPDKWTPDEKPTAPDVSKRQSSPPKSWIAFATDSQNKKERNATREWLGTKVIDKNKKIARVGDRKGGTSFWGRLTLDDAGVKEAREYPGIRAVEPDRRREGSTALSDPKELTSDAIAQQQTPDEQSVTPEVSKRQNTRPKLWMALARDSQNKEEVISTREWLKSKVTDEYIYVTKIGDRKGGTRVWGRLTLDNEGVRETKEYAGIKDIGRDYYTEGPIALSGNTE